MATNIGGMLAQGGAMAGQQIGGGFQSVLGGLGGMLQSRADKQRREAEAQEVQNFIAKNANDPAAINAEGLRRQALNDPLADVFFKAGQLQASRIEAEQQQSQRNSQKDYVSSLGEEYVNLLDSGMPFKDVLTKASSDKQAEAIENLVASYDLDVPPELAGSLSSSDLINLLDEKKKGAKGQAWAKWINENPDGINDTNRASANKAALEAFGSEGPAKVAELEAKQIANEEKRDAKTGNKVVKVNVILNNDVAMFDALGQNKTAVKVIELAVGSDGEFTEKSKKFLENNASHAYAPQTDTTWEPRLNSSSTIFGAPSGQGGGDGSTTLGTLVGQDVLNQALSNVEFK